MLARLPLLREHRLRDARVVEVVKTVQPAAELDVRHGLDIEYQRVHDLSAVRQAPHQHGNGNDEARLVAQREMTFADAEFAHIARPRSE